VNETCSQSRNKLRPRVGPYAQLQKIQPGTWWTIPYSTIRENHPAILPGTGLSKPVKRTLDPGSGCVADLCIDQGGFYVVMSEQFLDKPNVGAVLVQVGGIAMPQAVNTH